MRTFNIPSEKKSLPFDGLMPVVLNDLLCGPRDTNDTATTNGTVAGWGLIADKIEGEIGLLIFGHGQSVTSAQAPLPGELTIHGAGFEITTPSGVNKSTRVFYPLYSPSAKVPVGNELFLKGALPGGITFNGNFGVRTFVAQTSASGNLQGHSSSFLSSSFGEGFIPANTTLATPSTFSTLTPADSSSINQGPSWGIILGRPLVKRRRVLYFGDSHAGNEYIWGNTPMEDGWFGSVMYNHSVDTYYARMGTGGLKLTSEDPFGDGTFAYLSTRLNIIATFDTVIIDMTHNDLANMASANTIYNKLLQIEALLYSVGVERVLFTTTSPYQATSTDCFLTTGNQTAGNSTIQANRVALNALIRARGSDKYVDKSDAVSFGGGDGPLFKGAGNSIGTVTENNGFGNTTRIYSNTLNLRYMRRANWVARVLSSSNLSPGKPYRVIKTVKSTTYDMYEVSNTTPFLNTSLVAEKPNVNTVFELFLPYTMNGDGVHLGPGCIDAMKIAMQNAGVI